MSVINLVLGDEDVLGNAGTELHALTSAVDVGKWSASLSGRFILEERVAGTR
jgi:hypothetical protein